MLLSLPDKTKIEVRGTNASQVADVLRQSVEHVGDSRRAVARLRSPWVSGSFYLFALLAVIALLLVVGAVLPLWVLPVVIIGGILGVAVVGAMQLRQDQALSQSNFLQLMEMAISRLPLLFRSRSN